MEAGDSNDITNLLTNHGQVRMNSRRISTEAVLAVLSFGREVHVRGAVLYAIGRNEVERSKKMGVDLSAHEGLHVVCTKDGAILTVYRNRSLSDLRPRSRSRSYRYRMTAIQKKHTFPESCIAA
jgi:hypothetical protein